MEEPNVTLTLGGDHVPARVDYIYAGEDVIDKEITHDIFLEYDGDTKTPIVHAPYQKGLAVRTCRMEHREEAPPTIIVELSATQEVGGNLQPVRALVNDFNMRTERLRAFLLSPECISLFGRPEGVDNGGNSKGRNEKGVPSTVHPSGLPVPSKQSPPPHSSKSTTPEREAAQHMGDKSTDRRASGTPLSLLSGANAGPPDSAETEEGSGDLNEMPKPQPIGIAKGASWETFFLSDTDEEVVHSPDENSLTPQKILSPPGSVKDEAIPTRRSMEKESGPPGNKRSRSVPRTSPYRSRGNTPPAGSPKPRPLSKPLSFDGINPFREKEQLVSHEPGRRSSIGGGAVSPYHDVPSNARRNGAAASTAGATNVLRPASPLTWGRLSSAAPVKPVSASANKVVTRRGISPPISSQHPTPGSSQTNMHQVAKDATADIQQQQQLNIQMSSIIDNALGSMKMQMESLASNYLRGIQSVTSSSAEAAASVPPADPQEKQ